MLATPIPELRATAVATSATRDSTTDGDPDLAALAEASLAELRHVVPGVPGGVELSLSTAIPRSVGLAGSSALVIATMRAVLELSGIRVAPGDLATMALRVEVERLGIAAGPQDRLVQAHGVPVSMRFDRDPPVVEPIRPARPLRLRVAWWPELASPSGEVHAELRRRHELGDDDVTATMRDLAREAGVAARALASGDAATVAAAMDTSFDLRDRLGLVSDGFRSVAHAAREAGWAVNSAGSGGALVMLPARRGRPDGSRDAASPAGHLDVTIGVSGGT